MNVYKCTVWSWHHIFLIFWQTVRQTNGWAGRWYHTYTICSYLWQSGPKYVTFYTCKNILESNSSLHTNKDMCRYRSTTYYTASAWAAWQFICKNLLLKVKVFVFKYIFKRCDKTYTINTNYMLYKQYTMLSVNIMFSFYIKVQHANTNICTYALIQSSFMSVFHFKEYEKHTCTFIKNNKYDSLYVFHVISNVPIFLKTHMKKNATEFSTNLYLWSFHFLSANGTCCCGKSSVSLDHFVCWKPCYCN